MLLEPKGSGSTGGRKVQRATSAVHRPTRAVALAPWSCAWPSVAARGSPRSRRRSADPGGARSGTAAAYPSQDQVDRARARAERTAATSGRSRAALLLANQRLEQAEPPRRAGLGGLQRRAVAPRAGQGRPTGRPGPTPPRARAYRRRPAGPDRRPGRAVLPERRRPQRAERDDERRRRRRACSTSTPRSRAPPPRSRPTTSASRPRTRWPRSSRRKAEHAKADAGPAGRPRRAGRAAGRRRRRGRAGRGGRRSPPRRTG